MHKQAGAGAGEVRSSRGQGPSGLLLLLLLLRSTLNAATWQHGKHVLCCGGLLSCMTTRVRKGVLLSNAGHCYARLWFAVMRRMHHVSNTHCASPPLPCRVPPAQTRRHADQKTSTQPNPSS